jgi:hypothetical protein
MLLADTMTWFFCILGLMLALPGLWLLCRGLCPTTFEATTADCARGLWKPFFVGLPILGLTIFAVSIVSKLPGAAGGISSVLVVSLFVLFASSGVAGLATTIGQRLPSPTDKDRPWKATIRGGIVLELAYLVPFLGWFVLLPGSLVVGAGSALRSHIGGWRNGAARKSAGKKKIAKEATISISSGPPDISLDGTIGAST